MTFHQKVIIITGSSQGIGFKTAQLLAERGACLVVNSRNSEKVSAAVGILKEITPQVIGIAGDVSDHEFCLELRNKTMAAFGKIDILINNAGIAASGLLTDKPFVAFEKVVKINLLGSVHPTMACVHDIREQKGAILFISSLAGIIGLPKYAAYSATKRAITSLAESLRTELAGDGVFVGINYPGFTENDDQKTFLNARGEEEFLQKREQVRATPQHQTAMSIITQIEKRRFSTYSTAGKATKLLYSLFPTLSLNALRRFRKKIYAMQ